MLTDAIGLALKHGTYVFDKRGIIDRENATFCFDDGDFTPNYSGKDFAASEVAILEKLNQGYLSMSPQDSQLRLLGPQYISSLLGTMNRKDALRIARKRTSLPVEPVWQNKPVEYELTLLGYWLMREAQRNLPFGCVEAAIGFSQKNLKEQEDRLKLVFEQLKCGNWYALNEYRTKKFGIEKRQNPLEALPRQYGQFPSSMVRPNCLGISAMLCGWCELAGVEYMYVNTVRDRSSVLDEMLVTTIRHCFAWCEENGITIPEEFRFAMQHQLEDLAEPYTASSFHHCVAVKLEDNYWLMLDPYQEILSPISPINWSNGDNIETTYQLVSRLAKFSPGTVVWYETEDYEAIRGPMENFLRDSLISSVDAQLYIKYFGKNPDELFGGMYIALQERWFSSFWDQNWESCGISGVHLAFPSKKRGKNHKTFYECMYGWVGASIFNQATNYRFADLNKMKEYYCQDAGFAARFGEVFTALPIILLIQKVEKLAYDDRAEYNHFAVEFGNPAFQLACNTLNHLAAWDDEFSRLIDPFDIAKFSGSQLVWHDALARWYNTDQSQHDADWEAYLLSQLSKLQMYQWHFRIRQLLTHPDQEEPNNAENDEGTESRRDQEAA